MRRDLASRKQLRANTYHSSSGRVRLPGRITARSASFISGYRWLGYISNSSAEMIFIGLSVEADRQRERQRNCSQLQTAVGANVEARMRLLIVEDEARIAELVRGALARAGFAVDAVALCAEARAALTVTSYDAAIVDLGLPDGDGLSMLAELRANGNVTPVLVLTARDAVEDRVRGLDTGADDYLVKPFAMEELIARTKALLRRPGGALGMTLKAGNISFDTVERDVAAPRERNPGTSDAASWSRCTKARFGRKTVRGR
jgi:CheY-like chemotaxis protein